MAALGELVVKLSANVAEFTGAMDKAAYMSEKRMDAMVKAANQAGAAMGAALVAAAGSVAVAMKLAVDEMDKLGESAQKLGVTTEALSTLEYIAGMSGVSVESLHGAINKLNKAIAEGDPAFMAMGVSVRDAGGELKTADVILKEMAGKFADYKDGAGKSALAMEAMGKSGADMVPMLNQGADGFVRLAEEAQRMGLVVGGEAAEAAGRFNDTMDRIGKTQQGIATKMAAELLPVLERGATEFELVAKNIDLVSGPTKAVTVLFQTLAVLGSDVAFVFKMTGQEIGGMAAQLAALGSGDFKGFAAIREMMVADAAAGRAELDAFQSRIMNIGTTALETAKKVESAGGGVAAPGVIKSAKAAAKAMDDFLTPAAKAYEKAMEQMMSAQLDADKSTRTLNGAQSSLLTVMSSPEWAKMPEAWQQTMIAQAAASTQAIEVADRQKRINDMIAATPTAKLEEAQARMIELSEAFESGEISAEQFSEAAGTYLGTLPPAVEKTVSTIDTVITNSFQGMADTLADFVLTGKASFGDLVNAMIRDLIRLEIQTQMTTAYKAAGGMSGIFSSIGSWLGGSSSSAPSSGGWESNSFNGIDGARASGGPVWSGGTFLVGENGPELLSMGSSSGFVTPNHALGGGTSSPSSVRVEIVNNGTPQKVDSAQPSFDAKGMMIQLFVSDINSQGPISKSMETRFGLNRAAGSY